MERGNDFNDFNKNRESGGNIIEGITEVDKTIQGLLKDSYTARDPWEDRLEDKKKRKRKKR